MFEAGSPSPQPSPSREREFERRAAGRIRDVLKENLDG
jgi:hypothetical protein